MNRSALLILLATVPAACSSDPECRGAGGADCPAGMTCEMGKCVPSTVGPGNRDAGPRRDALPMDTGGPQDAADAGEPPDMGPMPPNDGGPPPDGQVMLATGGLVRYGEFRVDNAQPNPSYEFTAFADFVDRANATYTVSSQTIPDAEASSCVVSATRLVGGAVGIPGDSLVLRQDMGLRTINFAHDPMKPGHFEPSGALMRGFFDTELEVHVDIITNGDPRTLGDGTMDIDTPTPFLLTVISPALGSMVDLSRDVMLLWAGGDNSRRVVVELYDSRREVSLYCDILDDNSYTIPPAAVNAFNDANPTMPFTLELRYETQDTGADQLEATATFIPVEARMATGVRWSAN